MSLINLPKTWKAEIHLTGLVWVKTGTAKGIAFHYYVEYGCLRLCLHHCRKLGVSELSVINRCFSYPARSLKLASSKNGKNNVKNNLSTYFLLCFTRWPAELSVRMFLVSSPQSQVYLLLLIMMNMMMTMLINNDYWWLFRHRHRLTDHHNLFKPYIY
jgi:hypothetical protein